LGEDLNGETGSEIMAAQDLALQNEYHGTEILQTEKESRCILFTVSLDSGTERIGLCNIGKWRVEQSVSERAILVNGEYIQRHVTVYVELHSNMCGIMGGNCTADSCVAVCRNWCSKVSVLWNGQCELTELLLTINLTA
jgi:hypothetical protein